MGKNKWLMITIAVASAMVILWTVPGLAQMRDKGQWGQGGQRWGCGQGQGYGPGYGSCPYNQGYQNSRGNWSNNPQANAGRRGPKGGGRNYQPNPQLNVPPVTQ
ncbi:MAG: hypothetical protein ACOZFS_13500 [Thermodesulfobacteriota bacterium]